MNNVSNTAADNFKPQVQPTLNFMLSAFFQETFTHRHSNVTHSRLLCSVSLLLCTQIAQVIFDREVTAIQGIDFSVLPDNNKAFRFLLLQHGTGHTSFNFAYLPPMDIVELPDAVDEIPVALIQILQHIFNLRYIDVIAV